MNKTINNQSTQLEKIKLFRSLFRGRDDVYPKRYASKKTGKAGYVPECGNEWVRGICEKPKIKCSDCRHRRLMPVTDQVIRWHINGYNNSFREFIIGVYPLLLDETCFFLAVDFDKKSWKEDALAFYKTCQGMGLPAGMERSGSGNGAHIWLFFSEAIPAKLARKLGSHLLTETMEQRPEIGLDSYDRLFPNQDTLPQGGFGNLIALPFQKKARQKGNSLFIDENFLVYEDQWEFLSTIRKVERNEIEEIVHKAEEKGRIIGVRLNVVDEDEFAPWTLPPSRKAKTAPLINLPSTIEITISNLLYIPKNTLVPGLLNQLIRLAAFQNPEFYKAQAMRLSTHDKPRIISCAEEFPDHIALPRGCFDDLIRLFSDLKIKPKIIDQRHLGKQLDTQFCGELRQEQKVAAEALLAHDTGVLSASTAFGKTVIASWLIAKRRVNTLILVHRKQLQEQWVERLSMFLDVPDKEIGKIGGGHKRPKGQVDVALIQSLVRRGVVNDIVAEYGHVIVDECHHLPARSFEQITREAKAQFITGLSATVSRKDGHHPIIFMQCGPIRHRVDAKSQARVRPFDHTVLVRSTGFRPLKQADEDLRIQYQSLIDELIKDSDRNKLIFEDVVQAVKNGRSPVILTERNEHLDILFELLNGHAPNLIVLRGGMSGKQISKITSLLSSISENEGRVLLATGKFIGEGFDDARLDTLFLTLPISWRGTIAQYVGRLHRQHDRKKEVIVYDYADLNVPMLERMFNRRCHGYEAVGYSIHLPASAVAGWPFNISLPVDPSWKSDYATSVKRLILDGVDSNLANLFVHAAKEYPPTAEGIERARSASEAFLYRRLETLPQTSGKFKLNHILPIPFDGWGHMEVDFCCSEAHLVIEIDGAQHFSGAEAYRRDRRKDLLLQENGYMILRFLSEDVGKNLDFVLNTILRGLEHRSNT